MYSTQSEPAYGDEPQPEYVYDDRIHYSAAGTTTRQQQQQHPPLHQHNHLFHHPFNQTHPQPTSNLIPHNSSSSPDLSITHHMTCMIHPQQQNQLYQHLQSLYLNEPPHNHHHHLHQHQRHDPNMIERNREDDIQYTVDSVHQSNDGVVLQTSTTEEEERIAQEKAAVDPRKYKTRMCRNWELTGQCPYEHTCCFAHSEKELRDLTTNHKVLASIGYFSNVVLLAMTNGQKPALPPHCLYQQPQMFKIPETSEQLHACSEVLPSGVAFPFQLPLAAAFKGFRKEKQKRKNEILQKQQQNPSSDSINPFSGTITQQTAARSTGEGDAVVSKAQKRRSRRNRKAQEAAAAALANAQLNEENSAAVCESTD
jgi:hypothetical protein